MHEPADGCWNKHCYIHHVDEEGGNAYIVCFECHHVYLTAGALRREYRRCYPRHGGLRVRWRVATMRAAGIFFCPLCLHDF